MINSHAFFSFQTYLFDLDNTIFDEKQYLFPVYSAIASKYNIDENEFISIFLNEGRERLFNTIIQKFNLPDTYVDIFLEIQRSIVLKHELDIYPVIFEIFLKLISQKKDLLVVTNGNIFQQKNKVNQINWKGIKNEIKFIFANEIAPKPSEKLFIYLKNEFHLNESETIMIGDSIIDEEFAKKSNISFHNVEKIKTQLLNISKINRHSLKKYL